MPYITDVDEVRALARPLGEDAVLLTLAALACGWRVMQNGRGGVSLVAPGDPSPKRLHLSARNKGKGDIQAMMRTVERYGVKSSVEALAEAVHSYDESDTTQYLHDAVLANAAAQAVLDQQPGPKEEREEEVEAPVDNSVETVDKPVRYILTERPAVMHYSLSSRGGRSYPSKTAVERTWTDGTVDYRCAVASCDAISDNKRSFRGSHWAMHVRNGEAEPISKEERRAELFDDPDYVSPDWSRKSSHRDRQQARIAAFLSTFDLATISAEELAGELADFLTASSDGPSISAEPLSAEQVLDRIRRLVDTGKYADQEALIRSQQAEIGTMRVLLSTRVEASRLDEANARAQAAEENLRTLHAILEGVVKKDERHSDE